MPDIQPSLFSPRQTRRIWLEQLHIPQQQLQGVGLDKVKHLLKTIDSHHGRGGNPRLKRGTISHEMGTSEKTVTRAIKCCERLGLLIVRFRSFSKLEPSEYEIDWFTVKQTLLDCPKTTHVIDRNPMNVTRDMVSSTRDNLSGTRDMVSSTRDIVSTQIDVHTSSSRARSEPFINHDSTISKPSCKNDVFELPGTKKSKTGFSGWPFKITTAHLRDWKTVNLLWLHARDRGYVQDHHRVNFFVLCLSIVESRNPVYANPGGKLTCQVRDSSATGQWPGSNEQELRAQAAIAELDRPQRQATSDLSESNDFEAKRKASIAELMRKHGKV
jgi:hypothetical protein